jgi:hypothetical protein
MPNAPSTPRPLRLPPYHPGNTAQWTRASADVIYYIIHPAANSAMEHMGLNFKECLNLLATPKALKFPSGIDKTRYVAYNSVN